MLVISNKNSEFLDIMSRLATKFKYVMKKPIKVKALEMEEDFVVQTLEGVLSGKKGDFLMMGVQGELYPCKREIFFKTYDFV